MDRAHKSGHPSLFQACGCWITTLTQLAFLVRSATRKKSGSRLDCSGAQRSIGAVGRLRRPSRTEPGLQHGVVRERRVFGPAASYFSAYASSASCLGALHLRNAAMQDKSSSTCLAGARSLESCLAVSDLNPLSLDHASRYKQSMRASFTRHKDEQSNCEETCGRRDRGDLQSGVGLVASKPLPGSPGGYGQGH